ncbi:MAG TPA: hypothetical protein LFV90_02485 [Rickettsia endosymbiont of Columbicola hoogstraali]|nr:hypothetical protein [Rickettsia endosymbiont of Columbicola hoogstraali]
MLQSHEEKLLRLLRQNLQFFFTITEKLIHATMPNRGEYSNAADVLLRWVKAKGGVKLQGLVKRRAIGRSLFLSDATTEAVIISSA